MSSSRHEIDRPQTQASADKPSKIDRSNSGLTRGLNMRHIQFIALGSAIGTGLFYGSAEAIAAAGPAVILVYLVTGAAVYMVMRALGEMAVRHPVAGSFGDYATRYLGPLAGLITGWTYVFEMAVVAIADVTAFGLYMGFWFPDTPRWIWVVAVILIIAGINTMSVNVFGETEFWLTIIKVGAVIAMILGGIALLIQGATFSNGVQPGLHNLTDHGGFMPNGFGGVIAALAVTVFAFGGIENIGITAGEAERPEKAIPRAINSVPWRILIFYVGATAVLMSLVPWNKIDGETSPFVGIFQTLNIPAVSHIFNIVVISAAISAINSDVFGAGRVLFGMATRGHAPRAFARVSPRGVPLMTVVTMALVLAIGVVLNALMEDVFTVVASIATFATVWVWLMIVLSHIQMRRKHMDEPTEHSFPSPWWPVASYLALFFMLFVIGVLAYDPQQRIAFYVGGAWVALLCVAYALTRKRRVEH